MTSRKTYMTQVPDLLLRCRTDLKLSSEEAGKDIGISGRQVENVERRLSKPRRTTLLRIEDFLRKHGYLPKSKASAA